MLGKDAAGEVRKQKAWIGNSQGANYFFAVNTSLLEISMSTAKLVMWLH